MEFLRVAKKYVRRKAIWGDRSFVLSFLHVVFNELPIQSTDTA